MKTEAPKSARIVGIDLGTTNTVVAYDEGTSVAIFSQPQLVAEGRVGTAPLLPSVLFAPPEGEPASDPFGDAPWTVGVHARARGRGTPGRCVTSAKSWLSHSGIDRLAPTLPWGADPDDESLPRISPVEASRRILEHVRRTFDMAFPDAPLVDATTILTVPASFDEVARELTVRAAVDAGLSVRLLEEPLAAFYDHLATHGTRELAALATGRDAFALVCDVGGGTTDLTLIRVRPGGFDLDRVAVGRHLLLGGDNMDLALAHLVEPRMIEPPARLDPALFSELVLACREAKERLLADGAPGDVPVRLLSRGSRLVGATYAASLARDDIESVVLDGFFPSVDGSTAPPTSRAALVGFGLPYERDPAVTRHVAAFLRRHLPDGVAPDAVLLNGGVFRSARVRARLLESLPTGAHGRPLELSAPDPDLAVARGAVAFGSSIVGNGLRVGGGSARAYYVGLRANDGERRAVCVVPRGAREGERHVVVVPGLALVVGEPARFDLFSSDDGADASGAIAGASDALAPLPSMTASFDASAGGRESRVGVHLEGELTAVGTLDVACVETGRVDPRRFRLAFDLRQKPREPSLRPVPSVRPSSPKFDAARELVLQVYGRGRTDAQPRDARHLVRELERVLGERATWTTDLSRGLYDALLPESKARRRSSEHERTFWMLAGFCARPGYGFPGDDRRVGKLVPLLQELVAFPEEARIWQQFWINWRRVAGGLNKAAQTNLRDWLDPYLSTDATKPKKRKGFKPLAEDEMLEVAASLEAVEPARRSDLGRWLLERTWTNRDPRLWRAVGRVGARVPTYASAHHVVPPATVEQWLDHLLREKWTEVPTAAAAATQMARVTGDRTRDVSEATRIEIARRLEMAGAPPEWRRSVLEFVPIAAVDRTEFFGESLPVGLVLDV